MFIFQNIANKFTWLFALEFLWLVPFWEKPAVDTMRWNDVKEADPENSPAMTVEYGRMTTGFIITLVFGALTGALSSWAGMPKLVWFTPLFGIALFLWGKLKENDEYSSLVATTSLVVGVVWGLGAFAGAFFV